MNEEKLQIIWNDLEAGQETWSRSEPFCGWFAQTHPLTNTSHHKLGAWTLTKYSAYLRTVLQCPSAEFNLLNEMLRVRVRPDLSFMSKCMLWSSILGSKQSVTFAASWLDLACWNVTPRPQKTPRSLNLKPHEISTRTCTTARFRLEQGRDNTGGTANIHA